MKTNFVRAHAQTFCSSRPAAIEAELREAIDLGLAFVCFENDRISGFATACLGHPAGNADIVLLISPTLDRYVEIASSLFARLRETLPPTIRFTFFFPKENIRCAAFLDSIGALRRVNEYQLAIRREGFVPIDIKGVAPLHLEDGPAFVRLYHEIFPDIYLSAEEILKDIEGNHRVFVARDESGLIALSVLRLNGTGSATAEVIGVRADRRGRGQGRTVLAYLLMQAFSIYGAERVDLIVDLDNDAAIRLYTDLGFSVEREHVSYCLEGRDS
ncbi:MAG: hypothetical protein A2Y16_05870 [Tenericutes bacterium GWF2_57_13]|nr:MAG: hypothetical protein A2Y16_05870 [Tenericutes bacterium GWF2_57_13]